ncbi:MAG: hypothetical protein WA688_06365 [Thermoplasmata archaeon]
MRPWLVVVGIVFLTLALGTGATIYFAGQGNPSRTTSPFGLTLVVPSNESESVNPPGSNGTGEQFSFAWQSTGLLQVTLESPAGCTRPSGPCWNTSILAAWKANTSGTWAGSGPFHYPLQCLFTNAETDSPTVTLKSSASSTHPTPLSLPVEIVLGAGAGGLFAVGALAIFLGLFLRGDPYGPEAPVISRSPDDLEDLSRDPPPDH